MYEWFEHFRDKKEGTTLTINGMVVPIADCVFLAEGSEKTIYQIKETPYCFFIPHKCGDWLKTIEKEKQMLDQIISLGLKAQQFEIVSAEINVPGNEPVALDVLFTKDFQSLAAEESLVIYNHKGGTREQCIIGEIPDFFSMKEQFKDPEFARQMMAKIIQEYAIAATFVLPISILWESLDDSQHFCFELPKDKHSPPVARYMFWDVASEFDGMELPTVPTLAKLKSAYEVNYKGEYALYCLANAVSCAIQEMVGYKKDDIQRDVQKCLLDAIRDEAFLQEALNVARKKAQDSLADFVTKIANGADEKDLKDLDDSMAGILRSAISTDNVETVGRVFSLSSVAPGKWLEEDVVSVMKTAREYGNEGVTGYLQTHLEEPFKEEQKRKQLRNKAERIEQLRKNFIQDYNDTLQKDNSAWCGLYSFFVKSYVRADMSLEELVSHAQGHSRVGTGKRSQALMKKLGWLDNDNQLSNELRDLLKNENEEEKVLNCPLQSTI